MARCTAARHPAARLGLSGVALFAAVAVSERAAASGVGWDGEYLWAGPTLAATFERDTDPAGAFALGGELALGRVGNEHWWYGVYADGLYDFAGDEARLSVGPQVGWLIFGLDAGYLYASSSDTGHHGASTRFLITGGLVSGYVRGGFLFEKPADAFGEVGITLKLPLVRD